MSFRLRDEVLLFVGLLLCMRCGGRVIDESIVGGEGGRGSGTFSSTTGRGSSSSSSSTTTTGTTTGPFTTTTGDTSSATTTSSASSTSSATATSTTGGGPTTTAVSTTSATTGFGGAGMGGGFGTGGFGGASPPPTVACTSAPIPGSDQQINCRKVVGTGPWQCACGLKGNWTYCTGKGDLPCSQSNCCGFDTSGATGCAATPVTLPPISGCIGLIRGGQLGCAHVTQLNTPGYGPFTACCPPSAPYSCPTGTPNMCFSSAQEARNNCKDYCVQCVPTMF